MELADLILRGYRAGDLEAICRLDDECFTEAFRFSYAMMRRLVEQAGTLTVVAEGVGGELAGFVMVELVRRGRGVQGYVLTLDVAEGWRRRGVAAALMNEVERQAREAGAVGMELHVWAENEGAIRAYEAWGYERVGVVPGFYGVGRDGFAYRREF